MMGRTVAVVMSLLLAVSVANGQGKKKKDKEIPTVISKRGKLLLEDDFSEKDVLWQFDAKECEYSIVKGALVTKSKCGGAATALLRELPPGYDRILEIKTILPMNASLWLSFMEAQAPILSVGGFIVPSARNFCIQTWSEEQATKMVSVSGFPYPKPRWVSIVFEAIEGNYALTVDGKTVRWEQAPYEKRESAFVKIQPARPASNEVLAIDDVKVWEALPKDEEQKDDKNKGKKK